MANTNILSERTGSSHSIMKFYVLEVVLYVDTLGKDRSFTRLIREDGWPFALHDDGVIFPTFNVTQEDKEGINLAIRAYFEERKPVAI